MLKILLSCFYMTVLLHAQNSISPIPKFNHIHDVKVVQAFDIPTLKANWKSRIEVMRIEGDVPIIDVESSFNAQKFNPKEYAGLMDKLHVALIAFSPQVSKKEFEDHAKTWDDSVHRLIEIDPYRYVPTTTAGIYPVWTQQPLDFAKESTSRAVQEAYPLLGEFEFRHYSSPREVKRNETTRDVSIPIDSPAAHELFQFSERTRIPFEIHYEIEDGLLVPLEKMLQTYPRSKVIWCHLGQIRYSERAKHYTPAYVRELIERYPNLHFDLAFGDWNSIYPPSKEHQATLWNQESKHLKSEWIKLIEDHPYRFLIAFDIGGDRQGNLEDKVRVAREILSNFSPKIQEILAYKAFWRFVFQEDYK